MQREKKPESHGNCYNLKHTLIIEKLLIQLLTSIQGKYERVPAEMN
jgi:hypothetical protein